MSTYDMSFYCPIELGDAGNEQDKVVADVADLLDEYVSSHKVSVAEMSIALENYRVMLAVNSEAIRRKDKQRPLG